MEKAKINIKILAPALIVTALMVGFAIGLSLEPISPTKSVTELAVQESKHPEQDCNKAALDNVGSGQDGHIYVCQKSTNTVTGFARVKL